MYMTQKTNTYRYNLFLDLFGSLFAIDMPKNVEVTLFFKWERFHAKETAGLNIALLWNPKLI